MKPYAASGAHHSNQFDVNKWAEWDETRRRRARRNPNAVRATRRALRGKARAESRRLAQVED